MTCEIGNVKIDFVIDSGSPINAITEEDWSHLQKLKAILKDVRVGNGRKFQAYASQAPLTILHTFRARIRINNEKPSFWW